MRLSVIALCLALLAQSAAAAETLETAVANHMTVPYVLTLDGPAPRHVAVLYPGGDGVVAPHIKPNGRLAYKKKPNFLVPQNLARFIDNNLSIKPNVLISF